MNAALASLTVRELAVLSPVERDRRLCAMPSWQWHALADVLNVRLPLEGGDVPNILGVAIGARP